MDENYPVFVIKTAGWLQNLPERSVEKERKMEKGEQLIQAVKEGDTEKVSQLLDQAPELVNTKTEEGHSAVMLAAYYQKQPVVELLLQNNPELDIFTASAVGRVERVKELLEQDPERAKAFTPDGFQPLGLASFFGHTQVVKLLLDRGVEINTHSHNAQHVAPLNSAAAGKHAEVARLLLEKGADPNIRQAGGFTPLHSAAQNGDTNLARLLLEYGADPTIKADRSQTALEMASAMEHTEVVNILRTKAKE